MASTDAQILAAGLAPAPLSYVVPNAQELEPLAINAVFDGAAAAGAFVPTLEIVSDGGIVMARVPIGQTFNPGDQATATWAPFLDARQAAAASTTLAVLCAVHVAAVSIPQLGTHVLAFDHFRTSDLTVFGTCVGGGPINNAAGDTDIRCLKAGTIWWRAVAQWATALTQVHVGLVGSDDPIGSFSPESTINNINSPAAAPATIPVAQTTYGIYGSANVGDRQGLAAQNNAPDGLAHNINGAMLYGIWLPRNAITTVY